MSRIGNLPVVLPKGVDVTVAPDKISVKGPLGTLTQRLSETVEVTREADQIVFKARDESIQTNAMSGTLRALVANMIEGVTKGFEKKLQLVGVGYRAQAQGDKLNLTLGFSHPVVHRMPKGIKGLIMPLKSPIGTASKLGATTPMDMPSIAEGTKGWCFPHPPCFSSLKEIW